MWIQLWPTGCKDLNLDILEEVRRLRWAQLNQEHPGEGMLAFLFRSCFFRCWENCYASSVDFFYSLIIRVLRAQEYFVKWRILTTILTWGCWPTHCIAVSWRPWAWDTSSQVYLNLLSYFYLCGIHPSGDRGPPFPVQMKINHNNKWGGSLQGCDWWYPADSGQQWAKCSKNGKITLLLYKIH